MPEPIDISLPLFVPADRPERFGKAIASGADSIIIDLEDAVAPAQKAEARVGLSHAATELEGSAVPVLIRVNAGGTPWHDDDVAAVLRLPVAGMIVPKAESAADLAQVSARLGSRERLVALIESAVGVANAKALAQAAGRLAFGSIDFAADLGCAHSRDALLLARLELVLASRLAGLPGPIDGVTTAIDAQQEIEDDAAYAASLGFAGKLLIHPRQVMAARRGLTPTESEIAWAQRIAGATTEGGASIAVDGAMIDAPVLARAHQILRRATRFAAASAVES